MGVSLRELANTLRSENRNVRGGYLDEGDRQFLLRTIGKFESLKDIEQTVIRHGPQGTVTVGDVATVIDGRERSGGYVKANGVRTIAMGISRQSGANTVTTIKNIQRQIVEFNERFKRAGIDIEIKEVYSELGYVEEAINLVRNNLLLGGLLAAIVLSFFLRAGRPILIVLLSIPVSLITVFIVLQFLGRTINIISLAGIAFSVGMVIDNAIVVLENIDRHMRELGKPVMRAAHDAINEISGAIFASTLTTIAVFIPVILNTTEAGLLFKDIAIAIISAIIMSLLVAYTVVPSFSAVLLRRRSWRDQIAETNPRLSAVLGMLDLQWLGRAVDRFYQGFLSWTCSGKGVRTVVGRVALLGA
ncbi:efflux RND transporter permease subunit, partial [bacterium]|nr:efflux RND transporter permease subunit [bacterium]